MSFINGLAQRGAHVLEQLHKNSLLEGICEDHYLRSCVVAGINIW